MNIKTATYTYNMERKLFSFPSEASTMDYYHYPVFYY